MPAFQGVEKIQLTVDSASVYGSSSITPVQLGIRYQKVFENKLNKNILGRLLASPISTPTDGAVGTYKYFKPATSYVFDDNDSAGKTNTQLVDTVDVLCNYRLRVNKEINLADLSGWEVGMNGGILLSSKLFASMNGVLDNEIYKLWSGALINGLIKNTENTIEIKVNKIDDFMTSDNARSLILSKIYKIVSNFYGFADREINGLGPDQFITAYAPFVRSLLISPTIVVGAQGSLDKIENSPMVISLGGLNFIADSNIGRYWQKEMIHKDYALDNTSAHLLFVMKDAFAFPYAEITRSAVKLQKTNNPYLLARFAIAGTQTENTTSSSTPTFGKPIYPKLMLKVKFVESFVSTNAKTDPGSQAIVDYIVNKILMKRIELPSDVNVSTGNAGTITALKNALLQNNPLLTSTDLGKITFNTVNLSKTTYTAVTATITNTGSQTGATAKTATVALNVGIYKAQYQNFM